MYAALFKPGRRAFLLSAVAAAGLMITYRSRSATAPSPVNPGPVTIVEFTDAGVRKDVVHRTKVVKSDADWLKQLDAASFKVTREAGTEAPFSGANLNIHDKGVFRCICCSNALFDSAAKFDSGTGWPSFWAPIAEENVTKTQDTSFFMVRTAVSCTLCDAHLGHVFDDGPKPTGLRYCMNSLALRFAKAEV